MVKTDYINKNPSWGCNSLSDSQEIPRLLCHPKCHHRVHKNTPLDATITQMSPVHTLVTYYYPSSNAYVFQVAPSFQISQPKFYMQF
jgi:hypothetical protein